MYALLEYDYTSPSNNYDSFPMSKALEGNSKSGEG
jgi:hypothetical protein